MDYREYLLRPLTLRYVDHLVLEIFEKPSDFDLVYRLIYDSELKVAWRAAWACQKISEKHPEWFSDKKYNELARYAISTSHSGLLRGCLSILKNINLPDPIPVDLLNACFEWMISPKSAIAVQALSMKILYRICRKEPGFTTELIACLENIDTECYSAGFNSTRKNILNSLKNK